MNDHLKALAQKHLYFAPVLPSSSRIRRRQTVNKMKFSPNPDIDYSKSSLLDFVISEDDIFSVDVILESYKFLCILIENLCSNYDLHHMILRSGIIWKIFINLMDDHSSWRLKLILDPKVVEKHAYNCLRYVISNLYYLNKSNQFNSDFVQ